MHYLSVCAIVKNENRYLPEWIRYHKAAGVEHFYLFDNDSESPLRDDPNLKPFIEGGFVTAGEIHGGSLQLPLYDHVAKNFAGLSKWVAMIDADEFLVPVRAGDVRTILQQFEVFGGLGVNWLLFGSSGHLTPPARLTIENYLRRAEKTHETNRHIKSIIQPAKTASTGGSPHHFFYKPPFFCVNERKEPIPSAYSPHSSELIQLNHYFSRSREEYQTKMTRGRADTGGKYDMSEFQEREAYANAVEDRSILRFLPFLRG